jgi:predicted dehydrogenase
MIRVAILGAGFMGATHAGAWQALAGRVEVVTVASRTLERAQKLAADVGARATDDLDAAIGADVDLVDVCLPTGLHRRYAEAALAAGRHVLLEKPIALTAEDGEAIVAAAAASGRYLPSTRSCTR